MLLVAFAAVPTASYAYIGKAGLFIGPPNIIAQVDPIGDYGQNPSPHMHVEAGANQFANGSPIFGAFTQPGDPLTPGSTTTEAVGSNHDMVWFPMAYNHDGSQSSVGNVVYYIENNGYNVVRPPNGLRFIGGNPDYVGSNPPNGDVTFTCTRSGGTTYQEHVMPGPQNSGASCTSYSIGIFGPGQCFYPAGGLGKGMGSTEGAANITSDSPSTCAANGGEQIPLVEAGMDVSCNASGCGWLSSDNHASNQSACISTNTCGSSAHFDIVFNFAKENGVDVLAKIVSECLDDPAYANIGNTSCSIVNGTGGPGSGSIYEDVPSTGQPDWTDPDRVVEGADSPVAPSTGITLVGSQGAVTQGASGAAVTPAFGTGESETAGDLLVCDVAGAGHLTLPTTPSGWSVASQLGTGSPEYASSTILYKVATGGDAAPTIAAATGVTWSAECSEFTGNSGSPLKQSGAKYNASPPGTTATAAADAAPGDLVVYAGSLFYQYGAQTSTITSSLNNGATDTNTNNGATSTQDHYTFGWGVTTANTAADAHTSSWTATGANGDTEAVATFK